MIPNNPREQLIKLGAEKLADALLDLSTRSDQAAQLVEQLLSPPRENLRHLKARIRGLRQRKRFLGAREAQSYASDLSDLLADIQRNIEDPKIGLELVVAFFESDNQVLESCDDSYGNVGEVFRYDATELFTHYARDIEDKSYLSDLVFKLYEEDEYGVREELVDHASQFLPEEALCSLAQRFWENAENIDKTVKDNQYDARHSLFAVESLARQLHDAPLFERAALATWPDLSSKTCLDIAEVYLEAQEPEKALDWIKKVPPEMALEDYKRDKLLLDIYRKTNNQEKLAEVAWRIFRQHKDVDNLEELLSIIGEDQREKVIAETSQEIMANPSSFYYDISFLLDTNQVDLAQKYVLENEDTLNGDQYGLMLTLAQRFEKENRFLVSTIIYRELLESILRRAQSKYYQYGVRYLKKLEKLAPQVSDWQGVLPHELYFKKIAETHARKKSFWDKYEREGQK